MGLAEAEVAASLAYHVGRTQDAWRAQHPELPTHMLRAVVRGMRGMVRALTRRDHVGRYVRPVSMEEHELATQGHFALVAEHRVLRVLGTYAAVLRNHTPPIFARHAVPIDVDPEAYRPLFQDTEGLGMLIRCCNAALAAWKHVVADGSARAMLRKHLGTAVVPRLLDVMETATYVCLAHVVVFFTLSHVTVEDEKHAQQIRYRVRDGVVSDLKAFVSRVLAVEAPPQLYPSATRGYFQEVEKALVEYSDSSGA